MGILSDNTSSTTMAEEELSEEQLKQLLKDAEQRLRNKGKQQIQISTASPTESSLPQITTAKPIVSYIKLTDPTSSQRRIANWQMAFALWKTLSQSSSVLKRRRKLPLVQTGTICPRQI